VGDEGSEDSGEGSCPDGLARGGDGICRDTCEGDLECGEGRRCDGLVCVEEIPAGDGDADADAEADDDGDAACRPDADALGWRCLGCGYEHPFPAPPDVCPDCGVSCEDFEPM
jgi:hypothetical protein